MEKEIDLTFVEESPNKKFKTETVTTAISLVKDIDTSKCCIALSEHKNKKYKNTQTSIKVNYGTNSVRICDFNHWKDEYGTIESSLNNLEKVSTAPKESDLAEKCCNKLCAKGNFKIILLRRKKKSSIM